MVNIETLKGYIEMYKNNFSFVNQQEIYKWEAVKVFQENWDINAENFEEMLSISISQTKNLLKSGNYFAWGVIQHLAEINPEALRKAFEILFNEEVDLLIRIHQFQGICRELYNFVSEDYNTYQDHRAIIVYLTLRYPDRYYFYKFKMFKKLSMILNLTYEPIMGRIENILHYNSICDSIKYELSKDQELLKLHKGRINQNCYYDNSLNILTQDFIYSITTHLSQNIQEVEQKVDNEISIVKVNKLEIENEHNSNFIGLRVNYYQDALEMKRIGDLGEQRVLDSEKKYLKDLGKLNLAEKVRHISIEEGDGTGYDILSFDENGIPKYIEVKTTKGGIKTPFYITRTELQRSIKEGNKYYLYRIYNLKEIESSLDMYIMQGDLTSICNSPLLYEVKIKDIDVEK